MAADLLSFLRGAGSSVVCTGHTFLGLAKTIYIRCIYGNFGREITKYTVIYGVYIRFWPILHISHFPCAKGTLTACTSRVGQN